MTHSTMHQLFRNMLLAAALFLVPLVGLADYPDRPVSVVVAYSPGGATDFQARIVTMMAAKEDYLGQPIVIFNKPGAGGQKGWNWFADKASKDHDSQDIGQGI